MRIRDLRCALLFFIIFDAIVFSEECQAKVEVQLGFALDGSGSIAGADWSTQLTGLANVITSNAFPKDGTVELTIVQFGVNCPAGFGSNVEITPTIITANNYLQIASSVKTITQGGGNTPLSCGLNLLADTMFLSPNFDPNLKQVINIITDGDPNVCCASPSYCGKFSIICNAKSDSVAARNYLINKLKLTPNEDRITCEFIGSITTFRNWIRDNIVWPQPGMIAPPYPANNGWVRMIPTYNELEEAIKEKIKVIIPPKNPNASIRNNQINQNINQNVLAVGGYGRGPNSYILLPQNAGNTANANGQNNQIDQNINQNVAGVSQNALGGKMN
jgi:hypothetical protein